MDKTDEPEPDAKLGANAPKQQKKKQVKKGGSSSSEESAPGSPSSGDPKQIAENLQAGTMIEFKTENGLLNQTLNVPGHLNKELSFTLSTNKENKLPLLFEVLLWPNYVVKLPYKRPNVGVVTSETPARITFVSQMDNAKWDRLKKEYDEQKKRKEEIQDPYLMVVWMVSKIGSNPSPEEIQNEFGKIKSDVRKQMNSAKICFNLWAG